MADTLDNDLRRLVVQLPPALMAAIDAVVAEEKRADPGASRARVVRRILQRALRERFSQNVGVRAVV